MPITTHFFLIRHGESAWNAEDRYQGQADPPLTPRARRDTRALAGFLDSTDVAVVASSDLIRARDTAEIIVSCAGTTSPPVRTDVRLRERDAGEWTGMLVPDIDARWPGMRWRVDTGDVPGPPGGETSNAVAARAAIALAELAAEFPGRGIAVVTHGGVIRCLGLRFGADWYVVPNLGIRTLLHDGTAFRLEDGAPQRVGHRRSRGT